MGYEYLTEQQIADYKDAFNIFGEADGTVSTKELGPMLQYLGNLDVGVSL
jgi:Ca2+-binding EF-hand superfamily protein